ncbi:MAG: hypothetical protein PVH91_02950 [Pseudomonadales bacterium]|jgi:hypothetical protein
MDLPDLAIINFSDVPEREARSAIRAVNRQVLEDFLPIWGSGYYCKLHHREASTQRNQPEIIAADPVRAAAAIYLVDRARISAALGYCSLNTTELPVAFVFTDLGDWTVTLSHEVLELIVDSTLGYFLTEGAARGAARRGPTSRRDRHGPGETNDPALNRL